MANGAIHAAETLTDLFRRDHRRLDVILAAVKQALRAGDIARARAHFAEFRDGLERHIDAEEEVLFPAFEKLAGVAECGPTQVMRLEHSEIRKLMAEVAAELEPLADAGGTTPLAALTARIYAHNGKEERILYPGVDRAARHAGTLDGLLGQLRTRLS